MQPYFRIRALSLGLALFLMAACAGVVEVPIETPVQSKIDVTRFRRVLVAGFVADAAETEVEVGSETVRLLQNQLRNSSKLEVMDPDEPPLEEALHKATAGIGRGGRLSKQEQAQFRLESDRILQDAEYWRRIGEEFQGPLIVTGRMGFEPQTRSGFQAEERVVRDPTNPRRSRVVRGNRYSERQGFSLKAEFLFLDGRTGAFLHREKFTEEVIYGEDQKVSPLSSYFELMDRILPSFLGVISTQKIRGSRTLLP